MHLLMHCWSLAGALDSLPWFLCRGARRHLRACAKAPVRMQTVHMQTCNLKTEA